MRQIVVMGGGGFLVEPRNPRLDRYVLSLTNRPVPRVCFVGTASGDSRDFIRRFHLAFAKHPCRASDFSLFRRDGCDPTKFLLGQDIIYVGGGNTANMLAIWRLHGIDKVMRRAWERGVILCGVSAGMICWFESSVTDSFGPLRELDDGLGMLPGSACPHYDGEAQRRPTFHRLIREKKIPGGVAADDGAAIHYIDRNVYRCVASKPGARVYRVALRGGRVVDEAMPTVLLSPMGGLGEGVARRNAARGGGKPVHWKA
jgi:peptidase E